MIRNWKRNRSTQFWENSQKVVLKKTFCHNSKIRNQTTLLYEGYLEN